MRAVGVRVFCVRLGLCNTRLSGISGAGLVMGMGRPVNPDRYLAPAGSLWGGVAGSMMTGQTTTHRATAHPRKSDSASSAPERRGDGGRCRRRRCGSGPGGPTDCITRISCAISLD